MTDKMEPQGGGQEKHIFLAGTVTYPPANGNGNVLNPMPMMMQQGALCRAKGMSPSAAGFQVVQVLVKVVQDPAAAVSGDPLMWMLSNPVASFTPSPLPASGDPAAYDLTNNSNLQCKTTPSTTPNNKLFVASLMQNLNQPGMPVLSAIDTVKFIGVPVSDCTGTGGALAAGAPIAKAEAGTCGDKSCSGAESSNPNVPTVIHGHRDCSQDNATCCHQPKRDWYSFDSLSVDNPNGNSLHLRNRPLRARTIAVAARDVCWRTNPASALVIRRPSGMVWDDNSSGLPFRFPQHPAHSIVIYQPSSGLSHVLHSDCIERPDIVSLDPNGEFIVLVNDRWLGYPSNSGSFSLSVAIREAQ